MPFRDERDSALAKAARLEVENARLRAGQLTVLDGIGIVLTLLGIVFLMAFPVVIAPSFARVFADLGNTALPAMTAIVLVNWFAPAISLVPLAMMALALSKRTRPSTRRPLALGAFLVVLGEIALCVYGLYAPIFAIPGAIRAD